MDAYKYQDATVKLRDGVFQKWQRIHIKDIPRFLKEHPIDSFITIQRFSSLMKSDDELSICPLYFDFDGETLEEAQRDALALINHFMEIYDISKSHIKISFSGNRGFHVVLHEALFGIAPSKDAIPIFKIIASDLKQMLDLKSLDLNVYTRRRMWRIENSIHSKSNLYCVELYLEELQEPIDKILEIAKNPRTENLWEDEEKIPDEPNEQLVNFYNIYKQRYEDYKLAQELEPINPTFKDTKNRPVCILSLLNPNNYVPHTRNKSLVALATYFKDIGTPLNEAISIMTDWSLKIHTDTSEAELKANARSVANTVYSNNEYHFACSFIRNISKNIECNHEDCKVIDQANQVVKNSIPVSLHETTNAIYVGKNLLVNTSITGTSDSPFVIPKSVKVTCKAKEDASKFCEICPLKNEKKKEFTIKADENALNLLNVSESQLKTQILKILHIPTKCPMRPNIDIEEYHEVWEIIVSPNIKSFSDEENKFINRFCYYFGHDIEINKNYRILCKPTPEPRRQKSVLLVTDIQQLEDDLSFDLSDDEKDKLKEELSIFQAEPTLDGVRRKIYDIAKDLSTNVTEIYQREDLHVAIDLVYHSALSIKLPNTKSIERGKLELLVIGDSGQAKSTVFTKMQEYYKAGVITSGEASKRTGLVYSLKEYNGTWVVEWGLLVMQDRRLLCVDEFGETPDEEKQQLTQVRSSGIAECSGVVKAKAHARTRLIMLTNPSSGDMSGYDYGVQSIWGIFKAPADIRRLDFMLIVNKDEVSADVYNKYREAKTETNKYPAEACRNLLKFAWSRKATDIKFTEDAIKSILQYSSSLSEKYLSDIPLLEKADMRYKLSRIATATAIRVFSIDKDWNVLVDKCHVDFANWYLNKIYTKPATGFDGYAKAYRKQYMLDDRKYKLFKETVYKIYETGIREYDYDAIQNLLELFQDNRVFSKSDIVDMAGLTKQETALLFSVLGKNKFLKKRSVGYYKTNAFILTIKKLLQEIKDETAQQEEIHYTSNVSKSEDDDDDIIYIET